jgi:hypothetical protein
MPKLIDLEVGQRFRLPYCGKTGVVHRKGNECGTTIRYDGKKHNVVRDKMTGEVEAEFDTPNRPIQVSSETVVELLDAQ